MTPELVKEMSDLLPVVMYLESVGDYLGVHRTTWRGWLRRGRAEEKRLRDKQAKPKKSEAIYLQFFYACKKAIAEGEIDDARKVKKASDAQWQAAAWRLERRFPDKWGSGRDELKQIKRDLESLKRDGASVREPETRPAKDQDGGAADK